MVKNSAANDVKVHVTKLGAGDHVQYARRLVPDDLTAGDVKATFFVKFEPDDSDASFGPMR